MAAFKCFEEIEVWKDARELSLEIYRLTENHNYNSDPKLRWQMRGSSGSIMDNIAEGFSRGGNKEFIQFLRIARGSAGELQSQIYRAHDRSWLTTKEFEEFQKMTNAISRKCYHLIQHLQHSERKGPNFKQ